MKRVTIIDNIVQAICISLCAIPIAAVSYMTLGFRSGFLFVFAASCVLYLLLSAKRIAVYQPVLTTVVAIAAILCAFCVLSDNGAVLVAATTIWAWRVVVRRASLRQAALDGATVFVALVFAATAGMFTASAVLTVWCFFLTQSVTAAWYGAEEATSAEVEERFWSAERQARRALSALAR